MTDQDSDSSALPNGIPSAQPAELSDAYHKARRSVALFSGILIAWEYVGISVGQDDSGASGKLPGDVLVKVQNPEVVPIVIVILILYFLLRLTIEWHQCDLLRRKLTASNVDLTSTYSLAGISISLFTFQQFFGFRLADFLTPEAWSGFVLGVGIVAAITYVFALQVMTAEESSWMRKYYLVRQKSLIRIFEIPAICIIAFLLFHTKAITIPVAGKILSVTGLMSDTEIRRFFDEALDISGAGLIMFYVGVVIAGFVFWYVDFRFLKKPEKLNRKTVNSNKAQ